MAQVRTECCPKGLCEYLFGPIHLQSAILGEEHRMKQWGQESIELASGPNN